MTQDFIEKLKAINPDAAHGKRGRWDVIAMAWITQNPNMTLRQIMEGLEIEKGGLAYGSCSQALKRLVENGKITKTGKPFVYNLK